MATDIKEFCKKYKEKIKTDKDIAENEMNIFEDFRNRINFSVNMQEFSPGTHFRVHYGGHSLFQLDSEDLGYLYNKYSKKLEAEMRQAQADIEDSYKDVLNDVKSR
jgi:hypothetical protein